MKVIRLQGGLGNQMFQYVFYLKLKQTHEDVYLDTSWFNKTKKQKWPRQLQLKEAFNIEVPALEKNKLEKFNILKYPFWLRIVN